ncbi:MAG: hypothetical protein EON92_03495 [Burkholderiales bacterium]|nr:MAG: hypothetical protein EON92_03495 [Burkholderiales bacterium]
MGMRAEIQAGLAEAFNDPDGLADAVQTFTGSRASNGSGYDPDTGTTAGATTYTGRGVFAGYDNDNVDGSRVRATDTKLIALQNEVTLRPMPDDRINGQAVVSVGQDPAGATWVVQLR